MHMDRAIFDLRASVEATSLYILICALLDQGEERVTLNRAFQQWNGTREELMQAADELSRRGVVSFPRGSWGDDDPVRLESRESWR
ncbi:MAG: hypothetical protein GX443_06725 [Deltaproteobacteria bacterium]|nr:hypothetical protein [Deltaproteobacteria bacterium]